MLDRFDRFDLAEALYWYCADWHSGQWSAEYRILSTLGFNPGACASGPSEGDAAEVYSLLEAGKVTAEVVEALVQRG